MLLNVALGPSSWCSAWAAVLAWAVAGTCIAFAWHRRLSLERLAPPDHPRLLAELFSASEGPDPIAPAAQRLAIAELNERLADVSFELDVLPATYAALIRISLASGSALALVGFLSRPDDAPGARALRLGIAIAAGLFGAAAVASIGRVAKGRSRQIKEKWDISSRDIGKALGATLEAPASIRRNSFPE